MEASRPRSHTHLRLFERRNYGCTIRSSIPVHVRAKIYRIQTGEEVWLDYPRIINILRDVNYNGWMSIVYEGQAVEPEEEAVPKAVNYLRGLLNEGVE